MWAWGALMVELLTGARPWPDKSERQIMYAVGVKRASPTIPTGLPQKLEAVIRGCFAFDAAGRPAADEAAGVLQAMEDEAAAARAEAERATAAEAQLAALPEAVWAEVERRAQAAVAPQLAQLQASEQQLKAQIQQSNQERADLEEQAVKQKEAKAAQQMLGQAPPEPADDGLLPPVEAS